MQYAQKKHGTVNNKVTKKSFNIETTKSTVKW